MSSGTLAAPGAIASPLDALLRRLAWALVVLGVWARLQPFLEASGRFLQRFPTEDGYLMLTIARNLALGNGMSTAEGTLPTNGTQPLMTVVWAGVFWLVGGDKPAAVAVVLILELLIACAAVWAMARLAARVLAGRPHARSTAHLCAALWFASPLAVPHTMNCLETGAYALCAVLVALHFTDTSRTLTWGRSLAGGALLGLTFLVRNDAVFLIAAACLVQAFGPWRREPGAIPTRLSRTFATGLVSIAVASPWLIFNVLYFGHPVPVSGRAQNLTGEVGANLAGLPVVLSEYILSVLPIPHRIEEHPALIAISILICLLLPLALWRAWPHATRIQRELIVLIGLFGLPLCAFYGFYFGAGWFLARYLFPLSPFLTLFFCALLVHGLARTRSRALHLASAAILLLLVAGVSVRNHMAHRDHQHFQVVRWVDENVTPQTWIGAIQTGTLGFFHDRTINLDGKVNPEALRALLEGRLHAFVVASPVQYLVDWAGLMDWMGEPEIAANFEVLVNEPEQNLAVLKRRRP